LLRDARRSGGFTLREIGDAVEIDPSAIAAYELGRANPSVGAMNRWEAALERLLCQRSKDIKAALVTLTGTRRSTRAAAGERLRAELQSAQAKEA
jgi:transcriptional regulator with XRE-family HTH domain